MCDTWQVCLHEAGHAVVAAALNVPLAWVIARRNSGECAFVEGCGPSGRDRLAIIWGARVACDWLDWQEHEFSADRAQWCSTINGEKISPDDVAEAQKFARRVIGHYQVIVKKVADQLMKYQILGNDDVADALGVYNLWLEPKFAPPAWR